MNIKGIISSSHQQMFSYLFTLFVVIAAPAAHGELTTSTPEKISVREALSKNYHDAQIEISGVVLRQIGPNTVLVHDGTAAVEVDIPLEQIPPGGLKSNTRIRIKGEISHENNGSHEVEANQIFWSF